MITVKVEGHPDKAIKKLKRLVNNENTFNVLRERQYYTKPGEKRRLKKERAKARIRKRNQKLIDQYIKRYWQIINIHVTIVTRNMPMVGYSNFK